MIKYHHDIDQGTDAWYAVRLGLLTASEMKHILTQGKLQVADNDKSRAHLYELLAQRIAGYVEPSYVGDDMLRGMTDEVDAKILYDKNYAKVDSVGFVTNDKWGFMIGYSPDGLIGDDGLIECKSRRHKFQVETILADEMPTEYAMQVQTGLLVTERKWCDFITYSAGLPMFTKRIYPDEKIQTAIVEAATIFEGKLRGMHDVYNSRLSVPDVRLIPTERRIEQEITLGE